MEIIRENAAEKKRRPPWVMPSVSTLPKADKNAILRAKLLDASRRLRFGKIPVATQTDPLTESGQYISTKLMKEVNTEVQRDLIIMKDAENLTDGSITLRHYNPGEFLLTHSVTQMTDEICKTSIETQTPTPALCGRTFSNIFSKIFMQELFEKTEIYLYEKNSNLVELKDDLSMIDEKISELKSFPVKNRDLKYSKQLSRSVEFGKVRSFWGYDFSEDVFGGYMKQVSHNEIEPNYQVNKVTDYEINKKMSKMLLPPLQMKKKVSKSLHLKWTDVQMKLVNSLMRESNNLLKLFEEMSVAMGPNMKLNKIPEVDMSKMSYPSQTWWPHIEKCQIKLNELFKIQKPIMRRNLTFHKSF